MRISDRVPVPVPVPVPVRSSTAFADRTPCIGMQLVDVSGKHGGRQHTSGKRNGKRGKTFKR
ncbi:hypothetical protein KDW55_10875 [Burkholderia sp. AU19243]|uniref:hypothetical protein n=1 Tax=Burkholderia sp. AU19243 TaxID=2824810 RepID=UPI001B97024B|nr:hypothetical protein [Burkholderia sp. AU19243]MBR8363829.1 hypothetical protein [Burkholderia sp. AU19243]